jgi:hypothetical protein
VNAVFIFSCMNNLFGSKEKQTWDLVIFDTEKMAPYPLGRKLAHHGSSNSSPRMAPLCCWSAFFWVTILQYATTRPGYIGFVNSHHVGPNVCGGIR